MESGEGIERSRCRRSRRHAAPVESGEGIERDTHYTPQTYRQDYVESGEGIESCAPITCYFVFTPNHVESGEGIERIRARLSASFGSVRWNPVKELKVQEA